MIEPVTFRAAAVGLEGLLERPEGAAASGVLWRDLRPELVAGPPGAAGVG